MRLHSVRFKLAPLSPEVQNARADFITGLMTLHGCYLQKSYDTATNCLVWVAYYE